MRNRVAFLRGINVGGHKKIKMAQLRELFEAEHCAFVKTYLQSGNVVFYSKKDPRDLEKILEEAIDRVFSFDVEVIIRTPDEIQELIKSTPFLETKKSEEEQKQLYYILLKQACERREWDALKKPETTDEVEYLQGLTPCIYLFCKNGYGKTKMNNTFFEKKLSVVATTRNLRTIRAVEALLDE